MPSSPSLSPEVAIILAGGTGTRLGTLTAHTPKPLLEVAGRPFVVHLLAYLQAQGIRRVVFATGYLAAQFETVLGTRHENMELLYSVEEKPLGTGGAVAAAFRLLPQVDAAFVLNGDTYFPVSLATVSDVHQRQGAAATLALREMPDAGRYGAVVLEGNRIRALNEKTHAGPGLVNGGVYLVRREPMLTQATRGTFSLERDVFPQWASVGKLAGVPSPAYFIDIGVPEDLARAQREIPRPR
ncbi:MAG TPA: nucleotidyltransferase family protein [Candidatus Didemnitutus sp.]|nr:nucleotidyltransferase family protein [Candidatus Didemnitutus sp.]